MIKYEPFHLPSIQGHQETFLLSFQICYFDAQSFGLRILKKNPSLKFYKWSFFLWILYLSLIDRKLYRYPFGDEFSGHGGLGLGALSGAELRAQLKGQRLKGVEDRALEVDHGQEGRPLGRRIQSEEGAGGGGTAQMRMRRHSGGRRRHGPQAAGQQGRISCRWPRPQSQQVRYAKS